MMTLGSIREKWSDFTRGTPGRRFRDRYRRHQDRGRKQKLLMRVARFVAAACAIAVGAVLAFIPGPAVLFFLLGGGLLASEWLWVARFLDWLELRLRELGAVARRFWRRLPTVARAAVVVLAVGLSAASTWGVYQLVR